MRFSRRAMPRHAAAQLRFAFVGRPRHIRQHHRCLCMRVFAREGGGAHIFPLGSLFVVLSWDLLPASMSSPSAVAAAHQSRLDGDKTGNKCEPLYSRLLQICLLPSLLIHRLIVRVRQFQIVFGFTSRVPGEKDGGCVPVERPLHPLPRCCF